MKWTVLVPALIIAIVLNAFASRSETWEGKPVAVALQELQVEWIDECVKFPEDGLKVCVKNARLAIRMMGHTFRETDLHEGLRVLSGYVTASCATFIASLGPEDNTSTVKLAKCIDERFNTMIEYKGGMTEYLLWFEALDDPKV